MRSSRNSKVGTIQTLWFEQQELTEAAGPNLSRSTADHLPESLIQSADSAAPFDDFILKSWTSRRRSSLNMQARLEYCSISSCAPVS